MQATKKVAFPLARGNGKWAHQSEPRHGAESRGGGASRTDPRRQRRHRGAFAASPSRQHRRPQRGRRRRARCTAVAPPAPPLLTTWILTAWIRGAGGVGDASTGPRNGGVKNRGAEHEMRTAPERGLRWVGLGVRGSGGRGGRWVGSSKKGGGLGASGRWRTGRKPPLPGARRYAWCGEGEGKRSLDGFNRGNLTQPDGKTFWWSFYVFLEFLDCFQGFKKFSIGL